MNVGILVDDILCVFGDHFQEKIKHTNTHNTFLSVSDFSFSRLKVMDCFKQCP